MQSIGSYMTYFYIPGILFAMLYELCWRTNACPLRSPYGYLDDPEGDYRSVRERLTSVANKDQTGGGQNLRRHEKLGPQD